MSEKAIKLQYLANAIKKRVRDDKDCVIAVSGDEGDGKSTLAAGLSILTDPMFDFETHELFSPTPEEMAEKITGLPKYSVIIADEAIKILYKLNWQSKSQKFLNELYALCRKENKVTILCVPRFPDLNEYFRNHRVKYWIQVIDPISATKKIGHAAFFKRSWVPGHDDPWNLKELKKEIDKYSERKRIKEVEFGFEEKAEVLSRHRNFIGILEFEWLPKTWWDKYIEMKSKVEYGKDSGAESKESKRENVLSHRLKVLIDELVNRGESYDAIGKMVGLSSTRIFTIHKAGMDPKTKEATPTIALA